jgi:hypothetical protein
LPPNGVQWSLQARTANGEQEQTDRGPRTEIDDRETGRCRSAGSRMGEAAAAATGSEEAAHLFEDGMKKLAK